MKYFGKNWYIYLFVCVMGFAAGTALDLGRSGCLKEALLAIGGMEGKVLLRLAVADMLFNGTLYLWPALAEERHGRLMAAPAVWLKMLLMGYFCRELIGEKPGTQWLIMVPIAVLGGGAVCLGLLSRAQEPLSSEIKGARRQRVALFSVGLLTESIILPSVARTLAIISG